jgi:hypothetical protein
MTFFIIIVFVSIYLVMMKKAKENIPIVYLFLFTYFIQYLFSVYLMYNEYPVLKKQMPISQDRLFEYLVPAFLSLFAGLFLFNRDIDLSKNLKQVNPIEAERLGHLLFGISLIFDFLRLFTYDFDSIRSFTLFLPNGALMCYLFRPSLLNSFLIVVIFLNLLRDAFAQGIFINFFMWSTIFFFFLSYRYQISFVKRSLFILIAAPILIAVQSVKQEYRAFTQEGKAQVGVEFLTELAIKEQQTEKNDITKSDGVVRTIGRLNHGWHVAKVLARVPSKVPFANGADMLTDLEGVLLPRFFFPSKKLTGDHSKFEYYTGHEIRRTSMTIGVFGDFYINFGQTGAFIGLFIFGAIIAKSLLWFTKKYVVTNPINIVWIPVLFGYFIRADNDFYTGVNSAFKGFLIFLVVRYAYARLWPNDTIAR